MVVGRQVISPLQKLHQNQEVAVRIESELTEWFNIRKERRQRCSVCPICFNFYLKEVMRRTPDGMIQVGMYIHQRETSEQLSIR